MKRSRSSQQGKAEREMAREENERINRRLRQVAGTETPDAAKRGGPVAVTVK
jgi:hypothetical protein